MIDIHSHILWDIDDGARTLEESLAMLRLAGRHGTTQIVATPHSNSRFLFQPRLLEERLAVLRGAAPELIPIHSGCEFHLQYDSIKDAIASPTKYTICQRAYLIAEFSEMFVVRQMDDVLRRLMEAGMAPIITHPERNAALRKRVDDLKRWVDSGCLLQITAQSLLGHFGPKCKQFADLLLRRNLVHVVASDAHDLERRPPLLDEAYAYVELHSGTERARRLFVEHPRMILDGERITPAAADDTGEDETEPRRHWFRWRR